MHSYRFTLGVMMMEESIVSHSDERSTQLLTTSRPLQDGNQREGKGTNTLYTSNIVITEYSNG